jgi:hypothetical protein
MTIAGKVFRASVILTVATVCAQSSDQEGQSGEGHRSTHIWDMNE